MMEREAHFARIIGDGFQPERRFQPTQALMLLAAIVDAFGGMVHRRRPDNGSCQRRFDRDTAGRKGEQEHLSIHRQSGSIEHHADESRPTAPRELEALPAT